MTLFGFQGVFARETKSQVLRQAKGETDMVSMTNICIQIDIVAQNISYIVNEL